MYFAYEIPFPYIGVTLMALTCAWLMYGHVPTHHIVIWFFVGGALSLLRDVFVWRMKPLLARGEGYQAILWGFTLSSLLTGATWGAFTWMYFDADRPMSLVMAGSGFYFRASLLRRRFADCLAICHSFGLGRDGGA